MPPLEIPHRGPQQQTLPSGGATGERPEPKAQEEAFSPATSVVDVPSTSSVPNHARFHAEQRRVRTMLAKVRVVELGLYERGRVLAQHLDRLRASIPDRTRLREIATGPGGG